MTSGLVSAPSFDNVSNTNLNSVVVLPSGKVEEASEQLCDMAMDEIDITPTEERSEGKHELLRSFSRLLEEEPTQIAQPVRHSEPVASKWEDPHLQTCENEGV